MGGRGQDWTAQWNEMLCFPYLVTSLEAGCLGASYSHAHPNVSLHWPFGQVDWKQHLAKICARAKPGSQGLLSVNQIFTEHRLVLLGTLPGLTIPSPKLSPW